MGRIDRHQEATRRLWVAQDVTHIALGKVEVLAVAGKVSSGASWNHALGVVGGHAVEGLDLIAKDLGARPLP